MTATLLMFATTFLKLFRVLQLWDLNLQVALMDTVGRAVLETWSLMLLVILSKGEYDASFKSKMELFTSVGLGRVLKGKS